MDKIKNFKIYGMSAPLFVFFAVVIVCSAMMDIIPIQMLGGMCVLFTIGIILGEIGDALPIWKDYVGGGAMLAFVGAGLLKYFDLLPASAADNADGWINGYSFLNVFICMLIVGSIVGMERKVLIKSGSLFIPAILAAIAGSAIFGLVAGLVIGVSPIEMITAYVFPIMGGGAGAGAIPMAQVYEDVTGNDQASYLSFALAILSLANIVAILSGVVCDLIGKAMPGWTGHEQLLRDASKEIQTERTDDEPATMEDIGAAIFVVAGFWMLGTLVAKKILPSVFGVAIPSFAYIIIFAMLANILNLVPANVKRGLVKCQQFCGGRLVWIQMAGMGISAIDFHTMMSVLSLGNIFAVIMIVLGAMVGAAVFGQIVGFYPVESAICAGLCMANMGGAGDLAVLGAAKRMGLMAYAQISSRIGGAIILLLASLAFSFM